MASPTHTSRTSAPRRRWPLVLGGIGSFVVVVLVVGAVIFKPWLLFVNTEIHDEIPQAVTLAPSESAPRAAPVVVATGNFISHEHLNQLVKRQRGAPCPFPREGTTRLPASCSAVSSHSSRHQLGQLTDEGVGSAGEVDQGGFPQHEVREPTRAQP